MLVVDDEQDTRRLISTVIAQSGAEVTACASAGEALETLKTWRPHILMSDIGMPGEDGYALIKQVRALPPERGGRRPPPRSRPTRATKTAAGRWPPATSSTSPSPSTPRELLAAVSDLQSYVVAS